MEDANKNKTGANCIVSVLYLPESTCIKDPSSSYKTGIGPPFNPAHTACFGFMAPDFFDY